MTMTESKDKYTGKGLLQEDLVKPQTRFDGFPVVEDDPMELLQWILSVADRTECWDADRKETFRLGEVWKNHVLTVLADILHTDAGAADDDFLRSIGTPDSPVREEKMRRRFESWIGRLDGYVQGRWSTTGDRNADASVQAAQSMRGLLDGALEGGKGKNTPGSKNASSELEDTAWYRMVRALRTVQERKEGYLGMIESGGHMDPALALLVTFIRHYGDIVRRNTVLPSLPDFYHQEILRTAGRKAEQDRTHVVVTPAVRNLYLPEGYAFAAGKNAAGEDLSYCTRKAEQLTLGHIDWTGSLFSETGKNGKRHILSNEAPLSDNGEGTELFRSRGAARMSSGWQLESRMFCLSEGTRHIGLTFVMDPSDGLRAASIDLSSFLVQASTDEGWMTCTLNEVTDTGRGLRFSITVPRNAVALSPCTQEVHGTASRYPCIRILASGDHYPQSLAGKCLFHDVMMDIRVEGLRRFRLRNELGEMDPAQPFYPFGASGERGAWFQFDSEETDRMPLTEVALDVLWDKLPQTPGGYADIYRNYEGNQLTNASFGIATSYRTADDWIACSGSPQLLFGEGAGIPSEKGRLRFAFNGRSLSGSDRHREFRVVLDSPEIGFGMEEYRRLFAEVLTWNGRHNKEREIPRQPVIPRFAETSLSYRAESSGVDGDSVKVKLSRLTPTGEVFPCNLSAADKGFPLVEDIGSWHFLYVRLSGFRSEKRLCLFADLASLKKKIVLDVDDPSQENRTVPVLHWEYPCNGNWKQLDDVDLLRDETEGFTRSGYIEFYLPEDMDDRSSFTVRARIEGDVSQCLALKGLYLNCLPVTAENGDGSPLPAGTISKPLREDARIASVWQPLPGSGGRRAETADATARRQDERISHRNRAVAPKDFEQLVLEHFPDMEKVQCLPRENEVRLVVFSHTEGLEYPFTPAWRIAEIERWVTAHVSPFVRVTVCNPEYRKIHISCKTMLKPGLRDEGEVRRRLLRTIKDYFAAWMSDGGLPEIGVKYSYKELHTRIANDPGVERVWEIGIDGVVPDIDVTDIRGENDFIMPDPRYPAWTVLVPEMYEQVFRLYTDGINEASIDSDFVIQ